MIRIVDEHNNRINCIVKAIYGWDKESIHELKALFDLLKQAVSIDIVHSVEIENILDLKKIPTYYISRESLTNVVDRMYAIDKSGYYLCGSDFNLIKHNPEWEVKDR